jgi:hypothetical protein
MADPSEVEFRYTGFCKVVLAQTALFDPFKGSTQFLVTHSSEKSYKVYMEGRIPHWSGTISA